jgi:hypothetical protein
LLLKFQVHSGDEIEEYEMSETRGTYAERINTYRVLVGKPEGNRPTEGPRHRWEVWYSNVSKERGWEEVDRIHLAEDGYKWRILVLTVL